eukprot:s4249_g1.t1
MGALRYILAAVFLATYLDGAAASSQRTNAQGPGQTTEPQRQLQPDGASLPAWRADGLPTFHNAFPQSFNALSGSSQYYSQFRVRVPTVGC